MGTLSIGYSINGVGTPLNKSKVVTDEGTIDLEVAIADGQTNKLVACTLDISQLKALVVMSTKDMTLKTNDSSTPDDEFDLLANDPIVFTDGEHETNPLTADVTALYVTNASGGAGTLFFKAIFDATV